MFHEKPKVGGDVDALCSRCGMELAHTVVAMVGDKVVQARCNTCGSFHRYKAPKAAEPGRTARSTDPAGRRPSGPGARGMTGGREATPKRSSWEVRWQEQVDQAGARAMRPYRMTESFERGELVQHPRFGLGVVQQTTGAEKAEILFREGLRTLVMGRPPAVTIEE